MPEPRVLRCATCGDSIGTYHGEPPDPAVVNATCFECETARGLALMLSDDDPTPRAEKNMPGTPQ